MTVALYLLRIESTTNPIIAEQVDDQPGLVVVSREGNRDEELFEALAQSVDSTGAVRSLIIDDVVLGTGPQVQEGDTVSVHYVGTLQNGQEFDSSRERGEPFMFTVGKGQVIKGWDTGLVGMQVGGQRILVVPAELAYGSATVGSIPPHATLVFAIELLEIQ
jgi:FKBP-type peptidyl-prolyl cis-trans isomerase